MMAESADIPAAIAAEEFAEPVALAETAPADRPAISVKTDTNHLSVAEAALAQARAELAAAAALLETGKPKAAPEAATAETPTGDADDDLDDLFAPEPDAALDPNAVLLGPTPAPAFTLDPATAAVLPMHDMTPAAPPKAAAADTNPADSATPVVAKATAPIDPLAPLKAMSDEEKIALFS
jgi:hypothetical protein